MARKKRRDVGPFERCFLSLPHGFGNVRNSLKLMLQGLGIESEYVIATQGDTLRREVVRGLSKSSLLIADLSSPRRATQGQPASKGPRPNIMWELGFAWHAGMSVLIICREEDKKHVPALVSDQHLISYDAENLQPMLNEALEALELMLARRPTADFERHARDIYQSRCYVNRYVADLAVRFRQAKRTVRILELNLETIAHFYAPALIAAMRSKPQLTLQICTLNPFSTFAPARADQLADLQQTYQRDLCRAVEKSHDSLSAFPDSRWEMRIYDTFPTQIMFQIDQALFHSIIALGRRSRDMLHFEVQRTDKNASDTFEAHFAQIWNQSVPYERWYRENEAAVREMDVITRTVASTSRPVSTVGRKASGGRKKKVVKATPRKAARGRKKKVVETPRRKTARGRKKSAV